ncbi:MAG: c-type cytochrome [Acidimicrobiia bacterium]
MVAARSSLRTRMVAVLALVLVACSGVPEDASAPDVYALSCARCHGSQLEGGVGPALGAGTNSADQPDEYLVTTISRGFGRMPGFSGTLTDEQILALVAFLRDEQAG